MILFVIILVAAGVLGWIRLAPADPAVWNSDPKVTSDQDLASGVRRRIAIGPDGFEDLNGIILATPRTEVLAGSVAEGQVTYVTRSKWMGFPDYTTVKANELAGQPVLELYARQRFGSSDMGVNKARVETWIAELGPLEE
jgi:uncharacterized protein (DUF1499 family)